ncbi:MAG: class I SAM-dependent methyltransferase [Clostridia bacterium]|nr:class I SAM-dependent methyltransferase [Clostridia bacterium]
MEQHHYFLNVEHKDSDFFSFTDYFLDKPYTFKSCTDIFSKDCIDYGTSLLLKTVIKNVELSGAVLDVGCGYGAIGILLKKYFENIDVDMIDINQTAVKLSQENAKLNGVVVNAFESNMYENVHNKYAHIVTNPPIKAGKQNLFSVITGGIEVLEDGGTITLVIKKKHVMESLKNHMNQIFGNVEVLKKDKGYYILHSVKTKAN